jgi:GH18 family chitinase
VADDTDKVYTSTYKWTPQLFPYQQTGANVIYLTFLNPKLMPAVPPAMATLAQSRGSGKPGAVPKDTAVIFAIGGQAYSQGESWDWLTSVAKAEAMAAEVAKWPEQYGCDGIDLDIETGAGNVQGAGANLVAFVAKLKQLAPKMIVTQPVFGSPSSVPAANRLIEASYNKTLHKAALGSLSKVGIMVYSGTGSEQWTQYYTDGCSQHCSQWNCPLAACVPKQDMVLGIDGSAAAGSITTIANDVKSKDLGGVMVWEASALDSATGKRGLVYGPMDSSITKLDAWASALKIMTAGNDVTQFVV